MSDIFVSYSREDRNRVTPLVSALQDQGWTVWWDRNISPGDSFDERIEDEISNARVVLVVWSRNSVESRWVRNEALEGMDRGILVPVLLDEVKVPVAFRQTQLAKFLHLPTLLNEEEFHMLVDAIHAKLEPEQPEHYVKPKRLRLASWYTFASFVLLIALVAIVALWQRSGSGFPFAEEPETVAVMRFVAPPLGSGRQVADNLAERIGDVLRATGAISVVPRDASWEVPKSLTAEETSERLDARYLIAGTVSLEQGRMSIAVRIFDMDQNADFWFAEYPYDSGNVLAMHSQIADQLLKALRITASSRKNAIWSTRNPEAYAHFLQGQEGLRNTVGIESFATILHSFEQAVQMDPTFADAYSGLCRTHLVLYGFGRDVQHFEAAERHCHRSITLNANNAATHLALGNLYEQSNQIANADDEYRRALALDKYLADAYIGLGKSLATAGKPIEAERALAEAVQRQPGYWKGFNALGRFYISNSRMDEAVEAYTRVKLLQPENAWAYNNLGAARFFSGDFDGAIKEWEEASAIDPSSGALSNLGSALFLTRRFDEAAQRFREAIELTPQDHRLWGNLGDAVRFAQQNHGNAAQTYQRQLKLAEANLKVNPNDQAALGRVAISYAFLGNADSAAAAADKALSVAPGDLQVLYEVAVAYATMARFDLAAAVLSQAIAAGYSRSQIEADALFDDLRNQPEYAALWLDL